ncbi:MAG: 6-hydroxycyclohex-1-ene-1-carbonyl-CoA dehydrogenase [Bacteroidales bacterium]
MTLAAAVGETIEGWAMTAPGAPFEWRSVRRPTPGAGDAVVEVAGCGVCHTDVSFLHHGVKTRAALPLVLGHEISGVVVDAGTNATAWVGKAVVVPAVLSCGECDLCRAGARTICRAQVMPGNDRDGGFASHVVVPARFLCAVPDKVFEGHDLWELAIVSDAVTTPFQAVRRTGLKPGDLAVFVGAGGIGIHGVQIAAAVGAKVIALDVSADKLDLALATGAAAAVNVTGMASKDVLRLVRSEAERIGAPKHQWKIFETSGTRAGQETAFGLMGFGAMVAIVGFTMDRLEVRLSNLMAFDATACGNWGCDPMLYPEVLEWIAEGRIRVRPFVEKRPLADINRVFDAAHHGQLLKRAVLTP